jgi:hypothetical protein
MMTRNNRAITLNPTYVKGTITDDGSAPVHAAWGELGFGGVVPIADGCFVNDPSGDLAQGGVVTNGSTTGMSTRISVRSYRGC